MGGRDGIEEKKIFQSFSSMVGKEDLIIHVFGGARDPTCGRFGGFFLKKKEKGDLRMLLVARRKVGEGRGRGRGGSRRRTI